MGWGAAVEGFSTQETFEDPLIRPVGHLLPRVQGRRDSTDAEYTRNGAGWAAVSMLYRVRTAS